MIENYCVSPCFARHILTHPVKLPYKLGEGSIDFLSVMLTEINQEFLENHCETIGAPTFGDNIYQHSQKYRVKGKKIKFVLLWEPKRRQGKFDSSRIRFYKVNIVPGKTFPNFKRLKRFFRKLGLSKNRNHKISRLDYAVTFDSRLYPVRLFYFTGKMGKKRKTSAWKGFRSDMNSGRTTGYSAGIGKGRISIYDVDEKERRTEKKGNLVYETRFEVQGKPGIKGFPETIHEIPNILKNTPFHWFHFYDILSEPIGLKRWELKRYKELQIESRDGLHNACKILNKPNGNFLRDYSPLLKELRVSHKRITLRKIVLRSFLKTMRVWFRPHDYGMSGGTQ